jgi:LPS sulfotransferase NodH
MPDAMTSPILILGAPRSGTTWLAKIIDSHPDVLYRH